jgi:hypothetical protein
MTLAPLLVELKHRHVRLMIRGSGLRLVGPAEAITPDLVDSIRAVKPSLLDYLRDEHERRTADRALSLLNRLKTYTLPTGRMPAARVLAERLRPLAEADAEAILAALEAFERELVELGGQPDPELLEAVEAVEGVFPGTRLVEVKPRQ